MVYVAMPENIIMTGYLQKSLLHQSSLLRLYVLSTVDHSMIEGLKSFDISEQEIDAIFTQISQRKGYKITLILDCSHSCARIKGLPPTGMPRTICNVPLFLHASIEPMPEGVHQCLVAYLQYSSCHLVAAYDWQPDTSSHVVLAGCQENQYA